MAYQAIYRKWRPLTFEDIVGQTHVTKTLKNQIINGKTAHAYLFSGTRGTGKTTAAKVFSRAVNCENPKDGSPCNECATCRGILDGSILDVAEIDAASNNGVDNIRQIREDVNYVATQSKYRIYIIDEVHMLSTGAFNALLKTLEEPPEHVIFILATTEAHRVPETILSRCQRFDFKRIKPNDIIVRMKEIASADGIKIEEEAYSLLARFADGSMRDGLSIMERCITEAKGTLTVSDIISVLGLAGFDVVLKTADAIREKDTKSILELVEELSAEGKDLNVYIDSVLEHFKNLTVCKVTDSPDALIDVSAEDMVRLKSQAEKTSFEEISYAIGVLTKAKADAKWVKNPRIIYELALVKLTRPELDASGDALLMRIEKLEEEIKNGVTIKEVTREVAPKVETPKKEKKEPSAKLYAPLDVKGLNAKSPLVMGAKKWEKLSGLIARRSPFVASAVINRPITIDGEGIILVFKKTEIMQKKIASNYITSIQEEFYKNSGIDLVFKTAFDSDVEGKIVDYWSIPDIEEKNDEDISADPVDVVLEKFADIVELTDQSEFINYVPENFTQTELGEAVEDDSEEFLEDDEIETEE